MDQQHNIHIIYKSIIYKNIYYNGAPTSTSTDDDGVDDIISNDTTMPGVGIYHGIRSRSNEIEVLAAGSSQQQQLQ